MPRNSLVVRAPEHSLHGRPAFLSSPQEKSHAIGAFAVRRYPPEAEYNTGGLARCSALEHTHLLPLALTTSRREDNFSARPTKSLDIATATITITLTLARHTTRLSRSAALRPGVGISVHHPFSHDAHSFKTATTATAAAGTHARRRNSLARSPARIDPQLLSSQTRHPRKAGRPKPKFLRLSLPACVSSLSLHTLPSALLSRLTPHGRLHFPPTFAHLSHFLPHALKPT